MEAEAGWEAVGGPSDRRRNVNGFLSQDGGSPGTRNKETSNDEQTRFHAD